MNRFSENIDFTTTNNLKIDVIGEIDKNLSDILGGLSISYKTENNNTISYLEGEIIDQAELIGILNTLHNMRFKIISVRINDEATV